MDESFQAALTQIPLIGKINEFILNPLIVFFFAFALASFFIGVVIFVLHSGGDAEKLASGKRHLIWGVLGLFIMTAVFGFINLIIDWLQTL